MRKASLVSLLAGLTLTLPMAAHASLIGQTFTGSIVSRYGSVTQFSATVGDGAEFSGNVFTWDSEDWSAIVDVGADTITVSFVDTTYPNFGFLGFGRPGEPRPEGELPVAGISLTGFSDLGPMFLQSYNCPHPLACILDQGPALLSRASDGTSFSIATNLVRTGETYVFGAGAPEPSTWGLMIAGFGGMGAMLRRRRASAAGVKGAAA